MDKQAIETGIISASAIGAMKCLDYVGMEKVYAKYAVILLIAFILLIVFARKITSKL